MLELDYPTMIGLHVCNVLFPVLGLVGNFLPLAGELVLPIAVPFSLGLPPEVAVTFSKMGPMPDPYISTFRHHSGTATWTFPGKAQRRFSALSINECKFHFQTPRIAANTPTPACSGHSGSTYIDGGRGWITAWSSDGPTGLVFVYSSSIVVDEIAPQIAQDVNTVEVCRRLQYVGEDITSFVAPA